ncbi:Unknown protein, partial [Striga hermonthica]
MNTCLNLRWIIERYDAGYYDIDDLRLFLFYKLEKYGFDSEIKGMHVAADEDEREFCVWMLRRSEEINANPDLPPLSEDRAALLRRAYTTEEIEDMKTIPYASAVGSLMYAMACTRPDISYAVGMVARYQNNPGREHWAAVKHIFKYLRRTKEYMLVYRADSLFPLGYSDSDFQSDRDESNSTSGFHYG